VVATVVAGKKLSQARPAPSSPNATSKEKP